VGGADPRAQVHLGFQGEGPHILWPSVGDAAVTCQKCVRIAGNRQRG
jgi:hypothetical protein